jgi:phage-related minor tail protein
LGEAGPEAIMPLRRSGDGKLGVAAAPVSVTVNNYSDVKVSTAESTGDDGSRQISITIQREVKSMFGDGSMDKVMRGSYGLSRQAA